MPSLWCKKCIARQPADYAGVRAALQKAKDLKLIEDRADCRRLSYDVDALAAIFVAAKVGPGSAKLAAALAGPCRRCACVETFEQ